jgi:hypothetical protein
MIENFLYEQQIGKMIEKEEKLLFIISMLRLLTFAGDWL